MRVDYWVKKCPTRFEIYRRQPGMAAEKIQDPELDAINGRLLAGEAYDVCYALVKALKTRLKEAECGPRLHAIPDNVTVALKALKADPRHKNIDPNGRRNDLMQAAKACGPLLVESASKEALQNHIDTHYFGNMQIRRVMQVNQLLAFLGRPFRLEAGDRDLPNIAHITLPDFLRKLPNVEDGFQRLLFATLFATGCRVGEAFALKSRSRVGVAVLDQYAWCRKRKQWGYRRPKNKDQHNAWVIPELRAHVWEWIDTPITEREARRAENHLRTCRGVFGVGLHDLRHSYAIHLAKSGFDRHKVAANLGDGVQVVVDYYTGHFQQNEELEAMEAAYAFKGP